MEIRGEVVSISDTKVVVKSNLYGKTKDFDIFLTPKKKQLLTEHIVIVRSIVAFAVAPEFIELRGEKLCKLWLYYIIFPTRIVQGKRKKDDFREGPTIGELRLGKDKKA
ncbi:hypothetical protein [Chryseobacterium sp. 2VB]|uniref:hypothetical protein n=1 Tax=Chryseobacterium sp. 2VB TaxID=2502204 RepID=UPI0010F9E6DC|nr:hypothetical protein [Chryseobacterium sp. 2VB]